MERSPSTSDHDATSDHQKKPAVTQPLVISVGGVPVNTTDSSPNPVGAATTAADKDVEIQPPRKKHKVRRKPPPTETMINVPEESNMAPSMGATTSVYGSGLLLPETRLMSQNETRSATMPHQIEFMVSSMPLLPLQYRSMSATPTGALPLLFGSLFASAPPGALSYWSHPPHHSTLPTSITQRFPQGFQTTQTHHFPQGYHASEIYRSPVATSLPSNTTNFSLHSNSHSSLAAASRYAVLTNTSNSMGIGTPSSQLLLQRTANQILEDMLLGQQYPQPPNPALDAILGVGNTHQERRSVPSTRTATARHLPAILGQSDDVLRMNEHQAYLRQQIEVFEASHEDLYSNTRGRNRRIHVAQVGIRCRHCAHIPPRDRQMGTVYFPATVHGLYQAAQNMSTNHVQCGLCSEMPESVKRKFVELLPTKNTASRVGRRYWEESARLLGLVDTDNGIAFQPNPGT